MLRSTSRLLCGFRVALSPCTLQQYSSVAQRKSEWQLKKTNQYAEETKEFIRDSKLKQPEKMEHTPLEVNEKFVLRMRNGRRPTPVDPALEERLERMHEEGFDREHEKTNSPIF